MRSYLLTKDSSMGFEIKLADWNQEKAKHCDSIKFRKLKAKLPTKANTCHSKVNPRQYHKEYNTVQNYPEKWNASEVVEFGLKSAQRVI